MSTYHMKRSTTLLLRGALFMFCIGTNVHRVSAAPCTYESTTCGSSVISTSQPRVCTSKVANSLANVAAEDPSPCIEGPACERYFIACDAPDGQAKLRRPPNSDSTLEYVCTVALDPQTCQQLQLKTSDGDPFAFDTIQSMLQRLLPSAPLQQGGAKAIDRFCLITAHELVAHGSGKSCPNCKEEAEGYAAQKACLEKYAKQYCSATVSMNATHAAECAQVQESIKSAAAAVGFFSCRCQQGTTCQSCEQRCNMIGGSQAWCNALACAYCK
jgi:hypothetical protein